MLEGGDVHVHGEMEKTPVPLSIHHIPIATSFAVVAREQDHHHHHQADNGHDEQDTGSEGDAGMRDDIPGPREILLLDPSLEEEAASDAEICVVVNVHGQVCAINKAGGALVELELVHQCVKIAAQKAIQLTRVVREAVNAQHAVKKN